MRLPAASLPLSALLTSLLLSACGSPGEGDAAEGGGTAPSSSAAGGTAPGEDTLTITVDPGDGSEPATYTLSCAPVGGTLPDATAVCAHLQQLDQPFAPVPDDAMCSQQYGGAQTARVSGRWHGQDVDLQLSRTDGCRISQWDDLGPLLPGRVG